jgi:formylglycine-generating enzyme required for sulfatase activity
MADLYRYAAFISYSSKDATFARRLHRALEAYRIPKSLGSFDLLGGGVKPNRVYPVFRDREELSAGDLGERIETALRASNALIVVCSPDSAASPWVKKEIEYFASLGRGQRIFSVIPDAASSVAVDDDPRTYFPAAFGGGSEPLAADARKNRDGFPGALLKIIAGLIGVNAGALADRDRARSRAIATRNVFVTALASAAVVGLFTTQDVWRPAIASQLEYRRFMMRDTDLAAAPPGFLFQDCRTQSADCPTMVVLPAGSFLMGSAASEPDATSMEQPLRRIQVERFAVSTTEITFGNWDACVEHGGCGGYTPDAGGFDRHSDGMFETIGRWSELVQNDGRVTPPHQRASLPVINVSWEDAQDYVRWLSQMTGEEYRLLTEAEWEYAARAIGEDTRTRFSWGNDEPDCTPSSPRGAVFSGCGLNVGPSPVATFQANAFGLFDMHGNVSEWVQDCFREYDMERTTARAVNAEDIDFCIHRTTRGGSWFESSYLIRSARRSGYERETRHNDIGFRVGRTMPLKLVRRLRSRLQQHRVLPAADHLLQFRASRPPRQPLWR